VKPRAIALTRGERVLAVVPEYASGPGWANMPVWVHVGNIDGTYRSECLQPDEQSAEMLTLFRVGAHMQSALVGAVPIKQERK
jgi:hypothetical protein